MRWRRSILVVSSSSRRAFLAAGLAADIPDGSHLAESVRGVVAALRTLEELGVRNKDDGEEQVQGGARSAAMAAAAPSIPWLVAAASAAAGCWLPPPASDVLS